MAKSSADNRKFFRGSDRNLEYQWNNARKESQLESLVSHIRDKTHLSIYIYTIYAKHSLVFVCVSSEAGIFKDISVSHSLDI